MTNILYTTKYSYIEGLKLSLKRNIEGVYFIFVEKDMIFNTLDQIKAEENFQFYKSGLKNT